MKATNFRIEITSLSGDIEETVYFSTELQAQNHFDEIAKIKWPMTYKGHVINASEYPSSVMIGSIRLVFDLIGLSFNGFGYSELVGNVRRELYRKP